jgi:hypothetical protein
MEESIYKESIYEKQLRERINNLELLGSLLTSCRIHQLQSGVRACWRCVFRMINSIDSSVDDSIDHIEDTA